MAVESHQEKPEPWLHDVLAPLVFLLLFVLFVYGSLLVAMLGFASWSISAYELSFFAQFGTFGIWALVLCWFVGWYVLVFIVVALPYFVMRRMGRYILADKLRPIMILAAMGIFFVPFILWRAIRNNHPVLRRRYRQKLKRQARGKKMQERLAERRRQIHRF